MYSCFVDTGGNILLKSGSQWYTCTIIIIIIKILSSIDLAQRMCITKIMHFKFCFNYSKGKESNEFDKNSRVKYLKY